MGASPRPYLEGAAEFDWSPDGSRVVYHTPGPGIRRSSQTPGRQPEGPPIFTAPAGRHAHFPTWSPDGAFIYFVQGSVPDALDLYRMRRDGTGVERLTRHDAGVSHPVVVDQRTLMYLVKEKDGSGPWLYALDVERRVPRRLGTGLDRYYSLAASADGRRLVATLANTKGTLWRLPVAANDPAGAEAATPIVLPTARGFSPRLGARVPAVCHVQGQRPWNMEARRRRGHRDLGFVGCAHHRWPRDRPRRTSGGLLGGS